MNVISVGAGLEQRNVIEYAKSLGLTVIAVDGRANAECSKLVDWFYQVDIASEEEVIKIAKIHNVEFVLPSPLGRYLTTVGAINKALNLSGVSKDTIEKFVLKERFAEHLGAFNFIRPKIKIVSSIQRSNLIEEVVKFGYPCIIKPSEGSGSRGVYVIRNCFEMKKYIKVHISELNENESTLIEEFIQGTEYGIDGIVMNSNFHLLAIRQKLITSLPFRQETGFIYPPKLDNNSESKILKVLNKLCETMNIKDSFMHADIIIANNEVFIIEASPRPAGLKIIDELHRYIFNSNPLYLYIEKKTVNKTKNIRFSKKSEGCIGLFFFDLPIGTIISIPKKKHLFEEFSQLKSYECNILEREVINETKNGKDLMSRGFMVLEGVSLKEIILIKEKIIDEFAIEELI